MYSGRRGKQALQVRAFGKSNRVIQGMSRTLDLAQRAQSLVVFHPVVLGDFLQQFQVILVQDAAVLVADFRRRPFDVGDVQFVAAAPPCPPSMFS